MAAIEQRKPVGCTMGITICPKHGRSSFVETCQHAGREIEQGKVPAGHDLALLGHLFVCDTCFDQPGFDRFADLAEMPVEKAIDDERWQLYEAACDRLEGREAFCLHCVRELGSSLDP
ncbi:hypothetical protein [Bradyrhizobium sp. HKCCYLS20291]|uniref:hypothetical protein n=1 Tax=Bradyrhizobium sp. HKCCYLS20291 TaxID=3420766 RepID=UPI003EBF6224